MRYEPFGSFKNINLPEESDLVNATNEESAAFISDTVASGMGFRERVSCNCPLRVNKVDTCAAEGDANARRQAIKTAISFMAVIGPKNITGCIHYGLINFCLMLIKVNDEMALLCKRIVNLLPFTTSGMLFSYFKLGNVYCNPALQPVV